MVKVNCKTHQIIIYSNQKRWIKDECVNKKILCPQQKFFGYHLTFEKQKYKKLFWKNDFKDVLGTRLDNFLLPISRVIYKSGSFSLAYYSLSESNKREQWSEHS